LVFLSAVACLSRFEVDFPGIQRTVGQAEDVAVLSACLVLGSKRYNNKTFSMYTVLTVTLGGSLTKGIHVLTIAKKK